jgi:4-methyl-5(b-hydroxyethyl)-thiazole monophosphate biosynthesis
MAGVEELEAIAPIDLLRRAGATVVVAAVGPDRIVTGRNDIALAADTRLADLSPDEKWDLVVLPGGPGVKHLRADPAVRDLVRRQAESGRLLAAICAAPTVLLDCGVLAGRRYTAHFSVATELPEIVTDAAVLRDGNIVTSRGAGTAVEFGLALIDATCGRETAEKVAEAVCWSHSLPR